MDALKSLLKQPYWVIALVVGAALVAAPCVTVGNGKFETHAPQSMLLVIVGVCLLIASLVIFVYTLIAKKPLADDAGVDLSRVREEAGVFSTVVGDCEIRVVKGRIERHATDGHAPVVLPCNEYFDDRCAGDAKSALGAYVASIFEGKVPDFAALVKSECQRVLGPGQEQQKTIDERALSYGAGRCLLLLRPLGHNVPVALVSTTTQRAGEGLVARISYLFDGMRQLVARLADARLSEVVMPILGAGHGRIETPLAFIGLLLAVAEAALHGQGGQRLRRVTIVLFQASPGDTPEVDPVVVRRGLALVASPRPAGPPRAQ
jgi:hypothetical protein